MDFLDGTLEDIPVSENTKPELGIPNEDFVLPTQNSSFALGLFCGLRAHPSDSHPSSRGIPDVFMYAVTNKYILEGRW